MEEYRSITDSPNYEVSNFGNVRNKKTKFVLKPRIEKAPHCDYVRYNVHIADVDGKQRNQKIHRLVAEAFIPKVEGKDIIDHIDGNTENNNVSNLRWATYSENSLNSKTRIDNVSGERNIFYSVQKQKWTYSHTKDKKTISCGFYDTKEEAIKAKETGDYNLMKTNTGEKHITYKANRNKYMFEKTTNGIRYRKAFATLEEAINERNKYIITI